MTNYNEIIYRGGMGKYQTQYQGEIQSRRLETFKDVTYAKLNKTQLFYFNRAFYGVNAYSMKERKEVHPGTLLRVKKVHHRAMKVLNILKNERRYGLADRLLNMFTNTSFGKDLNIEISSEEVCTQSLDMSLAVLRIDRDDILKQFIKYHIVPTNFKTLSDVIN